MEQGLRDLSALLRERARIDHQIATLIGYPAHPGHIGEFIAARIFDIEPNALLNQKAHDGYFQSGPLAGKSVNIKLYSKHAGLLAMASSTVLEDHPDYYLVITGAPGTSGSSKGTSAPLCVASVFLFKTCVLLEALHIRGVQINEATSIQKERWTEAMIYPKPNDQLLELTSEQRSWLELFALPL